LRVRIGLLVLLMAGLPAMAKVEVDFNPNLDFSQFKTYAHIGGVEHLAVKVDKDWKKADQDFRKGFESYPPSAKQIEQRKKSGRMKSQSQDKCNERSEGWTLQRSRDGGGNESWTKLAVLQ
jgi:hypothetical protein